jgi:predicted DNA-binding transcriptional regulator YafY
MNENMIALKVLLAVAKAHPEQASAMWQAARILLKTPVSEQELAVVAPEVLNKERKAQEIIDSLAEGEFPALRAEFDYADENGLHSHRTILVMGLTDGRDVKRNSHLPPADRYGYLLTGYCTLRNQIRSFRSSRISNLRTFIDGTSHEPNRQWREREAQIA